MRTRPVAEGKRRDHEVPRGKGRDARTGLLHHSDELVADPHRPLDRVLPAVRPQVRPADARGGDPHHGVAVIDELGVGYVFQPDVARGVQQGRSHGVILADERAGSTRVLDVFDFELFASDMAQIDSVDAGNRMGPDPDAFNS
jgi:hypothetical protein